MYYCLLLIYPLLLRYRNYYLWIFIICLVLKVVGKFYLGNYTHLSPTSFPDLLFAVLNSLFTYLLVFYAGIVCASFSIYEDYIKFVRENLVFKLLVLILVLFVTIFFPYYGIISFVLVPLLLPTFSNNKVAFLFGQHSTLIWLFHGIFLIALASNIYIIHSSIIIYVLFSVAMLFWSMFYGYVCKFCSYISAKIIMVLLK